MHCIHFSLAPLFFSGDYNHYCSFLISGSLQFSLFLVLFILLLLFAYFLIFDFSFSFWLQLSYFLALRPFLFLFPYPEYFQFFSSIDHSFIHHLWSDYIYCFYFLFPIFLFEFILFYIFFPSWKMSASKFWISLRVHGQDTYRKSRDHNKERQFNIESCCSFKCNALLVVQSGKPILNINLRK